MNLSRKPSVEDLTNMFAFELYEAEQKRKRYQFSTYAIMFSSILLLILLILSIISGFYLEYMMLNFIIAIVLCVSFLMQLYFNYRYKVTLHNYTKTKIISRFVSELFPSLSYYPKNSSLISNVGKANRFKKYPQIKAKRKGEDLIRGYINNIWVELSEVNINGLNPYFYEWEGQMQRGQDINHAFKGILLFMQTQQDKAKMEAIFSSPILQEHLKKLGEFWGSPAQLTIKKNGDCIIDISTFNKKFLEFSIKNKMYDVSHTEVIYMEIYLMLHSVELLTQELNNN